MSAVDYWTRPNGRIYNYDRIRHVETGETGSVLCAYPDSRRAEIQWDDSVSVSIVDWDDLEAAR